MIIVFEIIFMKKINFERDGSKQPLLEIPQINSNNLFLYVALGLPSNYGNLLAQ